MLRILNEDGEEQIGFVCDVCGKPINLKDELTRLRDDVSAWSKVVWRDGQEPKTVHGLCAHSYNYSVPAYSYSGDFHSVFLADCIFNWAEEIPAGTKLIHNGQTFSWKGLKAGCKSVKVDR